MAGGIPEHVRRLVAEHVYSIEQLEALLLLRGAPGRAWSPSEAARELYTQADSTGRWLDDLVSRGFAERVEGGYRWAPPADLVRTLDDLAEAYARRRVSMIQLIFSDRPAGGPDPVQSFADAFRLRDDDDDEKEGEEG